MIRRNVFLIPAAVLSLLCPRLNLAADATPNAPAPEIKESDFCRSLEYEGKCLISYSWGNQHGTEHLAAAEYRGSLASFLEGWFPAKTE